MQFPVCAGHTHTRIKGVWLPAKSEPKALLFKGIKDEFTEWRSAVTSAEFRAALNTSHDGAMRVKDLQEGLELTNFGSATM